MNIIPTTMASVINIKKNEYIAIAIIHIRLVYIQYIIILV